MARNFNGTSDKILMSLGAVPASVAGFTLAAIVRLQAVSRWNNILTLATSADATILDMTIGATNVLSVEPYAAAGNTVTGIATGWQLLAVSKPTGSNVCRGHRYVFSTGVWTHTDAVGNSADPGGTVARIYLGTFATSDFLSGDIEAAAMYDTALSDSQIESLPFTLMAWLTLAPKALWKLDQSATAQKIIDISGGGANESTLTGTTIAAASVPVFNYTDGFIFNTIKTAVTALVVQAVPCSFTASVATPVLAENLQAVPASTAFSAGAVGAAIAPQAVPASCTFSVATPKLAENLQAVPANVVFGVGAVSASESLQSVPGSCTFSSLVNTALVATGGGSTTFGAAPPALTEVLQAVPGSCAFSAGSVSAAIAAKLVSAGVTTFSSLLNVAIAPQAPAANANFSVATPKLAENLQALPGTCTFSMLVDVAGLPIQVTTLPGTCTFAGGAKLTEQLLSVPGSTTFSGLARAEWTALTTCGGFTAGGGAQLGYGYLTLPGTCIFSAATALRAIELVAVPPGTATFGVGTNIQVFWDAGLISGYATLTIIPNSSATLEHIANSTASLHNFKSAQALLRNRVEG